MIRLLTAFLVGWLLVSQRTWAEEVTFHYVSQGDPSSHWRPVDLWQRNGLVYGLSQLFDPTTKLSDLRISTVDVNGNYEELLVNDVPGAVTVVDSTGETIYSYSPSRHGGDRWLRSIDLSGDVQEVLMFPEEDNTSFISTIAVMGNLCVNAIARFTAAPADIYVYDLQSGDRSVWPWPDDLSTLSSSDVRVSTIQNRKNEFLLDFRRADNVIVDLNGKVVLDFPGQIMSYSFLGGDGIVNLNDDQILACYRSVVFDFFEGLVSIDRATGEVDRIHHNSLEFSPCGKALIGNSLYDVGRYTLEKLEKGWPNRRESEYFLWRTTIIDFVPFQTDDVLRKIDKSDLELLGDLLVGHALVGQRSAPESSMFSLPVAKYLTCDLDDNGTCDVDDLNLLVYADGFVDEYDLDLDETLDQGDVDRWLINSPSRNGGYLPYQYGDADLDGNVDAVDLNVVGLNWLQAGKTWGEGDFNGDGIVNAADLNKVGLAWADNQSPNSAVPEPGFSIASLVWILCGLAYLQSRR